MASLDLARSSPFLKDAVFFALDSRIRKAHLSDVNAELILTYAMLKKAAPVIIAALRPMCASTTERTP